MTNPDELEALAWQETRTVASLTKHERAWLKRRFCGWCEAPALGSHCYARSDLGPPCNMDQRRAEALKLYKPRARTLHPLSSDTEGMVK